MAAHLVEQQVALEIARGQVDGRAPAPPASEVARGAKDKEHAMSQELNTAIAVIGIDIGKNSFYIVGLDQRGAIALRQKWSRGQVEHGSPTCRPA